jgi:hypothetical protein
MKRFTYQSGHEVKPGDRITYAGELGRVEFVVSGPTGDPAMDWYLEQSPEGGVMIELPSCGGIFFGGTVDDEEDLEFVQRSDGTF